MSNTREPTFAEKAYGITSEIPERSPMKSATEKEKSMIFEQHEHLIAPNNLGFNTHDKNVHIPERPDVTDRDDTESVCEHGETHSERRFRRLSPDLLTYDGVSLCDFCVKRWRSNWMNELGDGNE